MASGVMRDDSKNVGANLGTVFTGISNGQERVNEVGGPLSQVIPIDFLGANYTRFCCGTADGKCEGAVS